MHYTSHYDSPIGGITLGSDGKALTGYAGAIRSSIGWTETEDYMKISFIGVGVMGQGMALNLAKNQEKLGFTLQTYARKAAELEPFRALGVETTQDLMAVCGSDIIFFCLPDTKVVTSVLDTLRPHLHNRQILVDCSTIQYQAPRQLGEDLEKDGIAFMDCPISGHQKKASEGTLTIMCGGREETFRTVKPYLDCCGSVVMYMGGYGCGQLTKMINNCVFNVCIASFCEMMPLGVKLGLDPEALGTILMNGSGSSYASKSLIPKILEGDFSYGFSLDRAYKDMKGMAELCVEQQVPLPAFNGTLATYQLALQKGLGNQYKGAMIRFYEDLFHVTCRKKTGK